MDDLCMDGWMDDELFSDTLIIRFRNGLVIHCINHYLPLVLVSVSVILKDVINIIKSFGIM